MEFKEVKVATLSTEEKEVRKLITENREKVKILFAKVEDYLSTVEEQNRLFWREIRKNHDLPFEYEHYLKGNTIYRQELVP